MEATFTLKKLVKDLFTDLEPEGKGKIHKETLKMNMQTLLMGKKFEDNEIDELIENMCPDEDGMISYKSYMNIFKMPQFTAEEAAATRRILKNRPDLLEGLMKPKELAAKLGYNDNQKVEKIVSQIKDCYLKKLGRRLKEDPPQSKMEVRKIEKILLNNIVNQGGSKDKNGK